MDACKFQQEKGALWRGTSDISPEKLSSLGVCLLGRGRWERRAHDSPVIWYPLVLAMGGLRFSCSVPEGSHRPHVALGIENLIP